MVNFDYLYEAGYNDEDYFILLKIFQKESHLLEPYRSRIKDFYDDDLVVYLKGREGCLEAIRISKKGNTLLGRIHTIKYTNEIGNLLEYLLELYNSNGKVVGSTKLNVQHNLMWFIQETRFSLKIIYNTIKEHVETSGDYTKSLGKIFWEEPHRYAKHKNIKDSKLYDLICTKYELDTSINFASPKRKVLVWLRLFLNATPPKKGDKDIYFTGSYDGDMEHIRKMKEKYNKLIKNEK